MRALSILVLLIVHGTSFAADTDDISKLLDKQAELGDVYVEDAPLIASPDLVGNATTADRLESTVIPPSSQVSFERPKDKKITIATDGKAAWASFNFAMTVGDITQTFRVSDVLVKTDKGWIVVASSWTLPTPNDKANKRAKKGELSASTFEDKDNDASLADAFKKLATDGLDAGAATRKDLVAIGSGPKERTTTGAVLAKAWKGGWQGKTTVSSVMTRVAKGGSVGWVAAAVELQKKDYKIPFTLFCVFEKTKDGWSLVHVVFTV